MVFVSFCVCQFGDGSFLSPKMRIASILSSETIRDQPLSSTHDLML